MYYKGIYIYSRGNLYEYLILLFKLIVYIYDMYKANKSIDEARFLYNGFLGNNLQNKRFKVLDLESMESL